MSIKSELFFITLTTFLILVCSDEVKDIEFTVTTLNCSHNETSDSTPERKPRWSSLKKPGVLSKVVRQRLSKSLYLNNKLKESNHEQFVITVTQSDDEKNSKDISEMTNTESRKSKRKKSSPKCLLL